MQCWWTSLHINFSAKMFIIYSVLNKYEYYLHKYKHTRHIYTIYTCMNESKAIHNYIVTILCECTKQCVHYCTYNKNNQHTRVYKLEMC